MVLVPASCASALQPLDVVPLVQVPSLDLDAVRAEDEDRARMGLPPRYAIPTQVLITPQTDGSWEDIDAETRLWRLRIASPGAVSLNLGFTRYSMPPGGQLLIYAPDWSDAIGPFTELDNEAHGELWTPVVLSDDIVVEVIIPRNAAHELVLELTSISVGYRGFGEPLREKSGSCNIDVVCPEGDPWRDEIQSVGLISIQGSWLCTGFMVNNTAQDRTPYLMSANHCDIDASNDASVVVYWNYQTSTCGGLRDGEQTDTQSGSEFKATYTPSDFALVLLDDDPDPSFRVAFAGWDRRNSNPPSTSAVVIHQPSGDEKAISLDYDPTTITSAGGTISPGDGTHIRVIDWDLGTTEQGSSGAPLFDQNKRVIGQLHGGDAACGNNESDWFGRFYKSWNGGGTQSTRLRDWLDPGGTGDLTLPTLPCIDEVADEDFEAGDFSKWPWEDCGAPAWVVTSGDKHTGTYSAQSGAISDSQSTCLEVTLTRDAGNVSFYRKVSSESGYDYLRFSIDGVEQDSWSGETGWSAAPHIYPVSAGTHTYTWAYTKDSTVSHGSDTAWIDDISFPPASSVCPSIPYSQDFSDPTPPDAAEGWTYYSSGCGRIEVVNGRLRMNSTTSACSSLNEAILCVDLAGKSNVVLSFFQAESGDESHPLLSTFSDHYDGDGVAVSNDGQTWYTVVNADELDVGTGGDTFTVCLDDAGIAYTNAFKIKFQQYDNYPWSSDGREWDNIQVYECAPPIITQQPQSQVACVGDPVTFCVSASSACPLSYQWRKDGVPIGGATSPCYPISSVVCADAGDYDCVVSCGSITSDPATLTVKSPPQIDTQPQSQTVGVGDPATFCVTASMECGSLALSYQWRKDGSPVGDDSDCYHIPSCTPADAGTYDCVVTNTCGSVTSDPAILVVGPCMTIPEGQGGAGRHTCCALR